MPLFKVSVESQVAVSAVVVSSAPTEKEALEEVKFLQSRARVNWSRGETKLGSITAPYEIWAHPRPGGGYTVSLFAYIPISSLQTVIAEDEEAVNETIAEQQDAGLIPWRYRGMPIGEYKDPIPTFWQNRQPNVETEVDLTLSSSTLYPGQSVTITAEITGSETPVGNIEFKDVLDGGFGTIVLTALEPDDATIGISRAQVVVILPAGTYQVVGSYLGSDGFNAAQSAPTSVTVAKLDTAVTITPPTPPIYAGQSVSLGIVVSHGVLGAPPPTGTVTLFDGDVVIASALLVADAVNVMRASFNLGALPPGVYSFIVQYDGDGVHLGSTGSAAGISVQQVPTTVTVDVLNSAGVKIDDSADPSTFPVHSQSIRFRATVTSGIANTVPTGAVIFKEGFATLGVANLTAAGNNFATAEITLDNRPVGSRSISALYDGNASFTANLSPTIPYTILKANTVVNLSSLNTPTKFGQAAQFDATVSVLSPATRNPFQQYGVAGSVTYQDSPGNFIVNFDSTGHALRSRSGLPLGSTQQNVTYVGTADYNSSVNSAIHTVQSAETTMTMFFNQEPVAWFITFTIFATVNVTPPGVGPPTPGNVSFSLFDPHFYGEVFLGVAPVNSSGQAQLTTSFFSLITDTYTFTCSYTGGGVGVLNYLPSSVNRGLLSHGYFG